MDPELARRLLDALVGRPMVNNAFRGTLVEAMLAGALAPEWVWQADGWGSYDFEGPGGIGLGTSSGSLASLIALRLLSHSRALARVKPELALQFRALAC